MVFVKNVGQIKDGMVRSVSVLQVIIKLMAYANNVKLIQATMVVTVSVILGSLTIMANAQNAMSLVVNAKDLVHTNANLAQMLVTL